VQGVRLKVW